MMSFRIPYRSIGNSNSPKSFSFIAENLGMMADSKEGIPRCAYEGVVSTRLHGSLVYIYPEGKELKSII